MELDVTTFPVGGRHPQRARPGAGARRRSTASSSRFDAADAPTHITADELRLKQVLLNLLSNAVKFTPDGGSVTVRGLDRRAPRCMHHRRPTPASASPTADQVAHLRLLPAGHAVGARARRAPASGLTLTRRIVELHGGRMWLESEVGVGSTFGLALPQPAWSGRDRTPAWREPALDGRASGRRRHRGRPRAPRSSSACTSPPRVCARSHVRTGEEGLAAVRALRPTAVVLDIHLPGMDGWDVLSAIKADPSMASHPGRRRVRAARTGPRLRARRLRLPRQAGVEEDLLGAVWRAVAERVDQTSSRRDIVVVDDDPTALELVRATLRAARAGPCTTCSGGAEAISVIGDRCARRSCSSTCSCPTSTGSPSSTRCAADPAHGRDPGRRPHGEVADGAGPPPAAGAHRVRRVQGRARPQLARRPADAGRGRRGGAGGGGRS